MFHKSLRILLSYRFHKLILKQNSRSCVQCNYLNKYQLCVHRVLFTSSRCHSDLAENLMVQDIKRLQKLLRCTTEEAGKVYQKLQSSSGMKIDVIAYKDILEWLKMQGATMVTIIDNCQLLLRPIDSLKGSFVLLKKMGWKATDDFLPLLKLTKNEIIKTMTKEPHRIRIQVYEFSQQFSLDPQTIGKYLAKNPFTFLINRDLLERKLTLILSGNIKPDALLKDLDIFRRGEDKIISRISFLAENEVDCILPWMVKCQENRIKKHLKRRRIRSLEELNDFSKKSGQITEEVCLMEQAMDSIESDDSGSYPPEINQSQSALNQKIVAKMEKLFECPKTEAIELYLALRRPDSDDLDDLKRKLKWLKSNNFTMSVVIDNCKMLLKPLGLVMNTEHISITHTHTIIFWDINDLVLLYDLDKIEENFILLRALDWRVVDDFAPLLTLTKTRIIKRGNIFRKRIYEMSDIISMQPSYVAKYCTKHSFIFQTKFSALQPKIALLLEYGVLPVNILRDLSVLEVGEDTTESRIEILKTNHIKHIMPWLIRCKADRFERFLEYRKSKGPQWNRVHDILMRKLMLHGHTANHLLNRYGFLRELDSESLNLILDLLLRQFTPQKIKENIHILGKSMAELDHRIKQLQSLGADTTNEIFFVKNDEEFDSFIGISKKKSDSKSR